MTRDQYGNESPLVLEVRVTVRTERGMYPGLEVTESATLSPRSFLEVAKVLGQFHDLVVAMDEGRKK